MWPHILARSAGFGACGAGRVGDDSRRLLENASLTFFPCVLLQHCVVCMRCSVMQASGLF